jgi:hypothetical protein
VAGEALEAVEAGNLAWKQCDRKDLLLQSGHHVDQVPMYALFGNKEAGFQSNTSESLVTSLLN